MHTMLRTLVTLLAVLCSGALQAAPALVGTWHAEIGGRAVELQLRENGSGRFDGESLAWQQLGGLLLVEQDGEVVSYAVSVKGERMTVSGGDFDGPVQFRRGKAPAAPVAAKTPASKPSAGGRAGLAGKWCYAASFSNLNSGGGSQSSRCFELRDDGTYTYAYQGSVSAYGGGGYGASSSESGDQGRWSADADSLTAQSVSNGSRSYRLERRNHPKTREPMICLDGDCYVTYWKKAPW